MVNEGVGRMAVGEGFGRTWSFCSGCYMPGKTLVWKLFVRMSGHYIS